MEQKRTLDPRSSDVASVVIRVKEWLQGQSAAQLPRTRKRLENALRPMCRLYTIPAHLSLESVLRWLIHRGMLQIEAKPARGEPQVTLHHPDDASSAGQELDADLSRRLERWWASAVATGTRPSHLRALLAALVQQVLTVRIDARPELVVTRLVDDGWLQLTNDDDGQTTLAYSLPAAAHTSAGGPEVGDEHRLRARLEAWLAAMRDREAESRPEGGPRRDWVRFDRALDSLDNTGDRPRLAALLLGACTVRWLTPAATAATATIDGGLYVSLMPPPSQKADGGVATWSTHVCPTFDEMWDDEFDARVGRKGGVDVLRGVYAYGFERPSLIQQKVVAPIVNGWDVFCQSQPGTGKSAALAMAVVQRVAALWTIEQEREKESEKEKEESETKASAGGSGAWKGKRNPMALVITPTRELALQMHRVIEAIGHHFATGPFREAHEAKQAARAAAAAAAAPTAVEVDHADDGREAAPWRRSGGGRDRRHRDCWRRERSREEGTMDDDDGEGGEEVVNDDDDEARIEEEEEEERSYHHRRGGAPRAQRSPVNSEPLLCHALVGATSVRSDMRGLKRGPLIVVGSIGRITDMANRKALYLKDLEMLVLDDSTFFFDKSTKDALAHLCETYLRGPRPQLVLATTCETAGAGPTFVKHHRRLWRRTAGEGVLKPAKLKVAADAASADRVALTFSADVSADAIDFFADAAAEAQLSLRRPSSGQPAATTATRDDARPYLELTIPPDELALEGVRHFYVDVDYEQWKLETFCDLYSAISIVQCIVFVNTRRKIDWLTEQLLKKDYTVSSLHGHIESSERELLLNEFRAGTSRVLITNDLLALGIDVPAVTLVVNYDLPRLPEPYLHRSGRCGRFGRKGVVINLVTTDDLLGMNEIAQHFALNVEVLPCDVADLLLQ